MENVAINLETVATQKLTDAELIALGQKTLATCNAIAGKLAEIDRSSSDVFSDYKDVFTMEMNYKTGKADVQGFVAKIWGTFPDEAKTPKEGNPAQFYNWNTAEAKHGNVAARGLKAVYTWINRNIDKLYTEQVPVVDAEGNVQKNEAGEVITAPKPVFQADAPNEAEKDLAKLLDAISTIMSSKFVSDALKADAKPVLDAIAASVKPSYDAEAAKHKAVIEARKPVAEA